MFAYAVLAENVSGRGEASIPQSIPAAIANFAKFAILALLLGGRREPHTSIPEDQQLTGELVE